ncbi:MAG: hypothetical protein KatS3mg095_0075 [Candidatus Parcubacteria bacterium]|nr:MAG: hypothetical protein KatS3mg095_0075 [Candidatus Parcubacteria bacterium]
MNFTEFINSYCNSFEGCLQGIYNLGVALAVLVAFFVFIFGAFKNLLSVVPDVKMEGKTMMRNAIIGLVVIFISGTILYWINPFIFNPVIIVYNITTQIKTINTKTVNQNINYGSVNFNVPILDIDLSQLTNEPCKSGEYTIRTTTYYTPIGSLDDNNLNLHEFLSNTTLQGKSLILTSNETKIINSVEAKNILLNSKSEKKVIDSCRRGWLWSWIQVTGEPQKNCDLAKTNQSESVKNSDVLDKNKAQGLIKKNANNIETHLRGAYGPVIPGKTAAMDINRSIFKRPLGNSYEAIKILACLDQNEKEIDCEIKNSVFIITDSGGGGEKWLDLYAGVGRDQLREFSRKKTDWAKVCSLGMYKLK